METYGIGLGAIGIVGEDWGILEDGEEEVEWVEAGIDYVGVTKGIGVESWLEDQR